MSPSALESCGEAASRFGDTPADWRSPDPGLLSPISQALVGADGVTEDGQHVYGKYGACPTVHSSLWNAMIAPLTVLRVSGFLW